MKKIILKVEGMTCSACSNHVEKYLNNQNGIIDASVNLIMSNVLIHYEDDISIELLGKYINDSGYKYGGIYNKKEENKKDNSKIYLIILTLLILIVMYISMSHMIGLPVIPFLNMMKHPINYAVTLLILAIPYLVYGKDILKNGIKNLLNKNPNMDTLVSLGVLTSYIYSLINTFLIILGDKNLVENLYFEAVCMIILFVKIGRYIDVKSKDKTKEAIKSLVTVTPEYALLKNKYNEEKITIDEVKINDVLIVKPGMKVAVDGEIIKGTAHFDESFITGESKPTKKAEKDKIVAGSINYDGIVEYRAEKIGPKSTISKMVHLVLEASNSKMKISRVVDNVSYYFVPTIIIIAILTFIINLILENSINESIINMVTVLVVACPCALGLATPLAIVTAIGTSAKNNILIKSSETLEIIPKVDTIIFDKTGTLTKGKLCINEVINYSHYNEEDLLNVVSNIEQNSSHPIAKAFEKYKVKNIEVENYKEMPGIGISAKINNHTYILGNSKALKRLEDKKEDESVLSSKGNSIIYVLEDNIVIAIIGVKDTLRKETKETIKKLKKLNKEIVMLTGDNEKTATIIGKEIGIEKIVSNLMPKEKTEYIKRLKNDNHVIIMVGDGINDAPSLATADVGISLNSSTDIAANSSNVIITNDNLEKIVSLLKIGKRTFNNIKQNLFWALIYNLLMIPVATGILKNVGLEINPMIASGAMMMSSLCVVFNALRLRRI